MSDPTPGSVRTGSRPADGPATSDGAPRGGGAPSTGSVSTTQSIPTSGNLRAQGPASGATPAAPSSRGPATGSGPTQSPPSRTPAGVGGSAASPGAAGQGAARTAAAGGAAARTARVRGKAGRGPRRAKLQLRHIDTWSAFKISLVLSIALFFIWMVAVGILYGVLSGLGVFNTLNDLFGQLGSANGAKATTSNVITPGIVFGVAAVIGAINIVLLTALSTVATFIYNLCSDLVGGLEVTLSERD
jgi:hypothetical protein